MPVTLAQLEQQALTLPAAERARLVGVLLESLQGPQVAETAAEWERDIADRVAAYDRGEGEAFPGIEVFAEARTIVGS